MKIGLFLICCGIFFGIMNPDRFFSSVFFIGIWGVLWIAVDYFQKHGKSYEDRGPTSKKLSDIFGFILVALIAIALLFGVLAKLTKCSNGGSNNYEPPIEEEYRR